nr:MAG TPA: hypothetical protein [Caudoviricetes sp.]
MSPGRLFELIIEPSQRLFVVFLLGPEQTFRLFDFFLKKFFCVSEVGQRRDPVPPVCLRIETTNRRAVAKSPLRTRCVGSAIRRSVGTSKRSGQRFGGSLISF